MEEVGGLVSRRTANFLSPTVDIAYVCVSREEGVTRESSILPASAFAASQFTCRVSAFISCLFRSVQSHQELPVGHSDLWVNTGRNGGAGSQGEAIN